MSSVGLYKPVSNLVIKVLNTEELVAFITGYSKSSGSGDYWLSETIADQLNRHWVADKFWVKIMVIANKTYLGEGTVNWIWQVS